MAPFPPKQAATPLSPVMLVLQLAMMLSVRDSQVAAKLMPMHSQTGSCTMQAGVSAPHAAGRS